MTTITATRTYTAQALTAELGRRKNNKDRKAKGQPPVRAKGFVLPALSKQDIADLLAGQTVTVNFKSGRTETVSLKG